MKKYIIKIKDNAGYVYYIGNGTYVYQGERYAVIVERPTEAKQYTTLHRAKTAYEKLSRSCGNIWGTVDYMEVL